MTKKIFLTCILILNSIFSAFSLDAWIRVNQLGYTPDAIKKAILVSESSLNFKSFSIHDALTNEKLAEYNSFYNFGKYEPFTDVYILNFSDFKMQGAFYLKAGTFYSPTVFINKNVYNRSADFVLNFIRNQRSDVHPVSGALIQQQIGVEVYGPEIYEPIKQPEVPTSAKSKSAKSVTKKQSDLEIVQVPKRIYKYLDTSGGWHEYNSYAKYGSTTAITIQQMLYAYRTNPEAFDDQYDEFGLKNRNGIPDIIDEAKWGIDWLLKMNPENEVLYYQSADDRAKNEYPALEEFGSTHPVYLATGKPQGLFEYKNRSTGIASVAGKYAAAFALGADVIGEFYNNYAEILAKKAGELYQYGKKNSGVCQTAPAKLPYFQAEDNWSDDMELAAMQLYYLSFEPEYLRDAASYARMEPVSPWVFADTANYYQWFPLINMGHFMLANVEKPALKKEFQQDILATLKRADLKRSESPFQVMTPMIQNSNQYVAALATQCHLYRRFSKDSTFIELETALTDWLFGCNPWGVNMIVGLPDNTKIINEKAIGGLVSGAVEKSVCEFLNPQLLVESNLFQRFQSDRAVFFNQTPDVLTNTPSLDGTASLLYLLSSKQNEAGGMSKDQNSYKNGGLIRTNTQKKQICLLFSGHNFVDGKRTIPKILHKQNIKASFFFTGDFLRNKRHKKLIKGLIEDGHYVGVHSDKNPAYCSQQDNNTLVISKSQFMSDLRANFKELEKFDIKKQEVPFFLPANLTYNDSISRWAKESGLILVNYSPGTRSYTDNSIPEMRENYFSSVEIYNQIMSVEKNEGLNGHLLLLHMGSDARRSDKFYKRIDSLIKELKSKGYQFVDLATATGYGQDMALPKNKKRKN